METGGNEMLKFTLLVLCITLVFLAIVHAIIGISVYTVLHSVFSMLFFIAGMYYGVDITVKNVLGCAKHNKLFAGGYRIIEMGKETEEPGAAI
jgi:hypothetical protein